jgi:hypothetical protein
MKSFFSETPHPTSHCTEAAYSDSLINLVRFGGSVNSAVKLFS